MRRWLTPLLASYQRVLVTFPCKVPAPEQVLVTVLLSQDRKLIRDRQGKWNHKGAIRTIRFADGDEKAFNTGFKDKTIEGLIEAGRLEARKYDGRGRPIEVAWVPF